MKIEESFYLRKVIVVTLHLGSILVSNFLAFYLRFDGVIDPLYQQLFLQTALPLLVIRGLAFIPFHLYQGLWGNPSVQDLLGILTAVAVSTAALLVWIKGISGLSAYPWSILFIDSVILVAFLGALRSVRKLGRYFTGRRAGIPLLIYGAGDAGDMVVRDIQNNPLSTYRPIGFIDDDKRKKGTYIRGIRILGARADLGYIIDKYKPKELLIAIPSASPRQLRAIAHAIQHYRIGVRIMPSLSEILTGKVSVDRARNLSMEDLMSRRPVQAGNESDLKRYIQDKSILVTGAGGSIGSELCRQVAAKSPRSLFLVDRYENSLHAISVELKHRFPGLEVKSLVGDVTDALRMESIFSKYKPQIVFHAAAHKHVFLAEENPLEAIRTNVIGTRNVFEKAEQAGAESFVLISTDKAVRPAGVMGMTKQVAELYLSMAEKKGELQHVTVRFGNVLGSNGSVIPIFTEQIKRGGPVTVTHPEVKRFFMLIPEAVHLVLQAAANGKRGDAFILDMGDQIRIAEVARNLIRFMGLVPDEDIKIIFTGLGIGEKMYEELYDPDSETLVSTSLDGVIKVMRKNHPSPEKLKMQLEELEALVGSGDEVKALGLLNDVVRSGMASKLPGDSVGEVVQV